MDKRWADKWAAALRSGEYKQGRDSLRMKSEQGALHFCCLGVLCDLVAKENPAVVWRDGWHAMSVVELRDPAQNYKPEERANMLQVPPAICDIVGMRSGDPIVDIDAAVPHSLSSLNDTCNYSFTDIADVIDEHWEKL